MHLRSGTRSNSGAAVLVLKEIRRLVGLMIGLSAALVSNAEGASLFRKAAAGKTTQMHVYYTIDDECRSVPGTVTVSEQPQHGRLSTRIVQTEVGLTVGGLSRAAGISKAGMVRKCRGRSITVLQVDYTPTPGFRGRDRFVLDAAYGTGKRDIDGFSVDVD